MVKQMQDAYVSQIDANTWMDDVTKGRAKEKVCYVDVKLQCVNCNF